MLSQHSYAGLLEQHIICLFSSIMEGGKKVRRDEREREEGRKDPWCSRQEGSIVRDQNFHVAKYTF